MVRQSNAVDFWRGFALVTIFINHIPGIYYSRFTHGNISISDSADLFVFLAGWSVRYVVGSRERATPTWQIVLRLLGRAFTLYAAQILITTLAIAMLAASATLLENPLLLEWHNVTAVFQDPVPTHIGLVLITHQLGYFDILPLYVVLLVFAPVMAVIDRYAPNWLLPISLAIYCLALGFRIIPHTWPTEGEWFFNPLAWQLIYVMGFLLAKNAGVGGWARRNIVPLRIVGVVILAIGVVMMLKDWFPDPTQVPEPKLFFIENKTYLTPIRFIQFLGVVAVFSIAFPYFQYPAIHRFTGPIMNFLSMLGRNSLQVFCVGSLLSLAGQILHFLYQGYVSIDTVVVIVGLTIMAITAWLSEWRDRVRPPRLSPSS
jgi:hypothetical protein